MFENVRRILAGTLRRQLIVGMALIVSLMMSVFVWDITLRQRAAEIEQQTEQAISLSNSVAASTAVWVASRDLSGLQEIVRGLSRYPDLRHAIVLDLKGQVLAHTDPNRIGLYLTDLPQQAEMKVLQRTANIADVASPIMFSEHQIGWVLIGMTRNTFDAELAEITRSGILYALIAIALSTLFAALAGRYLTRRLFAIQQVADAVEAGDSAKRASVPGDDEAAQLARQFNRMLDSLEQREAALQESEFRWKFALEGAGDGVWDWNPRTDVAHFSKRWIEMLGYAAHEFPGKGSAWLEHLHPEDKDRVLTCIGDYFAGRAATYVVEFRMRCKDGSWKWILARGMLVSRDADGNPLRMIGTHTDITARKQAEEQINNLAYYDPLTNLPNRRLLMDRLRSAQSNSARSYNYGALLFLDMDKFKTVNDTLGHDYGDLLLIEVARRIQSCVREVDIVARLGGDEFVVLFEEVDENAESTSQKVALVAEKIRAALTLPYDLKGCEQYSSPSIGVCLFLGKGESVDALLKHADMAMYQVKDSGRNAVRFFDPAMQIAVESRAALERDLRRALPEHQLHLYYQIQVDSEHRPLGAEGLLRWKHPDHGMISPMKFIPIAEESSLILEIGAWVLDAACHQLAQWGKNEQTRNLTLAVNVSAQQFKQIEFVESIAKALHAHGVKASRLKLELTESVVLNNVTEVVATMHALKALGVGLSMDDFGTGYSSLSYLKQLPLDQLKIDQSFIRDMNSDQNDAVMVKTIIDLAQNFRLNVIAEGVETEAQLTLLKKLGCAAYQGYYFSRPLPPEQFESLLKRDGMWDRI